MMMRLIGLCRSAKSATTSSRSSTPPRTETPRIVWPMSAGDGDNKPTGRNCLTAPLSTERKRISASAARPTTIAGVASLAFA